MLCKYYGSFYKAERVETQLTLSHGKKQKSLHLVCQCYCSRSYSTRTWNFPHHNDSGFSLERNVKEGKISRFNLQS